MIETKNEGKQIEEKNEGKSEGKQGEGKSEEIQDERKQGKERQGKERQYVEKPANELAADKYLNELKNAMADFDNYRKQVVREKQALGEETQAHAYVELLPVLDAFDNALAHEQHNEGVRKLAGQIKQILAKKGVHAFEAVGKKIDLEKCEVVEHVESELPEDFVVRELRKGYEWRNNEGRNKILRHALVSVSIGKKAKIDENKVKAEESKIE